MAKTILIVDDEFDFVHALAEGLEIFGYKVYKAGNGEKAIKVIEEQKPDVVLCDYKLPDMDGDLVLKQAKEHNPETKFIMVTAYYDEELRETFRKYGAAEVIYKPIVLNKLEELLRNI